MKTYKLTNPEGRSIEDIARKLYLTAYNDKTYTRNRGYTVYNLDTNSSDFNNNSSLLIVSRENGVLVKLFELLYYGNGNKKDIPLGVEIIVHDASSKINEGLISKLQRYFNGGYIGRNKREIDFWNKFFRS